jgi:rSAM/selenodomain-associated transferase 2
MMQIGTGSRDGADLLSVVIPALDESAALEQTLRSLRNQKGRGLLEVILADGGSRDGTVERFLSLTRGWAPAGIEPRALSVSGPGRALQLNAGARAARGDVVLFLHADTLLPEEGVLGVLAALRDPRVVGGGFRHRFREPGLSLRAISVWATARSVLRRLHYGDQAIFVRRDLFERLGGFPEIPLFEDLRFSRLLRRAGRVVTLRPPVRTSARRLLRDGIARTSARFAWLKIRHALGADPARLKSAYPDVR